MMNKVSDWKVPKWPFLLTDAILILFAAGVVWKAKHPIAQFEIGIATICVVLGALAACLPFILEFRAVGKLIELNAVGEVTEKIQDLKNFTAQITAATDQWAHVQEVTKGNADKTVAAAHQISESIAAEVSNFTEFQKKMNDAEKGALRLEVEKLRRTEGEWLQVVARILDHIFALHTAAVRSGQSELATQIASFQNACRDAARRVGLSPFAAEANEPFDAERHRAHGVENPPVGAIVAETLAPGLTFQGRLIRPALVRLQEAKAAVAEPEIALEKTEAVEEAPEKSEDELPL